MPTFSGSFFLVQTLLIIAILLQTFELLFTKQTWATIWKWDTLKVEYAHLPKSLHRLISFLLNDQGFLFVLDARVLFAILILAFPSPYLILGLLLTSILIFLRWRGTYNGGSDSMTFVILLSLTIATFFKAHGLVVKACFWYIALQTCLSYFVAGIVKLKKTRWRNGSALSLLVMRNNYDVPREFQTLFQNRSLAFISAWLILIFECSFPLALLHPSLCQFYIAVALCFHMANFFIFGLNRFVFAWMAAYPALYLASFWLSGFLTLR